VPKKKKKLLEKKETIGNLRGNELEYFITRGNRDRKD